MGGQLLAQTFTRILISCLGSDQARHERAAFLPLPVIQQLVLETLAARAPVHQHVIHRDQALQVDARLRIRQRRGLAHLRAAEPHVLPAQLAIARTA